MPPVYGGEISFAASSSCRAVLSAAPARTHESEGKPAVQPHTFCLEDQPSKLTTALGGSAGSSLEWAMLVSQDCPVTKSSNTSYMVFQSSRKDYIYRHAAQSVRSMYGKWHSKLVPNTNNYPYARRQTRCKLRSRLLRFDPTNLYEPATPT